MMYPQRMRKDVGTGLEERAVNLDLKQVTEVGTFEGYASVFDVLDSDREVVVRGAFERSLREKGPKRIRMLWQHLRFDPIGVWQEMREDDRGLYVKGKLALGTQAGKEAHELLKLGALDSMSIGFRTVRTEVDEDAVIRRLVEIDLWEVSLVTFPANEQARVDAVKTIVPYGNLPLASQGRPWGATAAESRVRSWAEASDAPNAKYRRAFIWYDRENADDFEAYKLQIADVIDGELTAVPRGIFAAAAVVQGAQGGADVPLGDMPGIRSHLGRYYAKMRQDFEDKSILAPWEHQSEARVFGATLAGMAGTVETKRDFEKFLRDAGFSRSEATGIVASGFKAISRQGDPARGQGELVASIRKLADQIQT